MLNPRAVDKCEALVKEVYANMGLEYRETDSEEDDNTLKPLEVIEILDEEDDDVMSVESGEFRLSQLGVFKSFCPKGHI